MNNLFIWLIAIVLWAPLSLTAQTTFNVPSAGFSTIQSAIDASVDGDIIIVAAGVYFENLDIGTKAIALQGAGIGQSRIDGGGVGSVLKIGETQGFILDGFTIENGYGDNWDASGLLAPGWPMGGGIQAVAGTSTPPSNAVILVKNCHFDANTASTGGAIFAFSAVSLTVEDCLFTNNTTVGTPPGGPGRVPVLHIQQNSFLTIRRSEISYNTSDFLTKGGTITINGAGLIAEDTSIHHNTCWAILGHGLCTLNRVQLHHNDIGGIILTSNGPQQRHFIRNSTIHSNGGPNAVAGVLTHGNTTIEGCTIANNIGATSLNSLNNSSAMTGGGVVGRGEFSGDVVNVIIKNSVVFGNSPADTVRFLRSPGIPQFVPPIGLVNMFIDSSCTSPSPQSFLGMGNITANPMFLDPTNDDYRLDPLSPCVDAGDQTSVDIDAIDFLGNPRVVSTETDMGAIENTHPSLGMALDSNVGTGLGGPYDLLKINGSTGDAARRVVVPLGTSSTMTLDQPPTNPFAADFLIFGIFGQPSIFDTYLLPGNIGNMAFTPCPAAPYLAPISFIYAGSFPFGTCGPLIQTGLTPWFSGPGPAIFFPLTITFQGVVEETIGDFKVTNGIIWEVK